MTSSHSKNFFKSLAQRRHTASVQHCRTVPTDSLQGQPFRGQCDSIAGSRIRVRLLACELPEHRSGGGGHLVQVARFLTYGQNAAELLYRRHDVPY